MGLRCKRCGSGEHVKNGLMRGKQRYRCKACGLNFTDTPPRGMPLRVKVTAVLLYLSGLSMNRTAKLLGVSTPSVMWTCPRRVEGWDQNVTRPHACRSLPCRRAPRPGCGSRGSSVAAAGCTTRRQNTHGTTVFDDGQVVYAWHPWAGRIVRVREVITRASGAVLRCSPVGEGVTRLQEIPAWMLDRAVCGRMRRVPHPVAELGALAALRALLSEAVAAPGAGGGTAAAAGGTA